MIHVLSCRITYGAETSPKNKFFLRLRESKTSKIEETLGAWGRYTRLGEFKFLKVKLCKKFFCASHLIMMRVLSCRIACGAETSQRKLGLRESRTSRLALSKLSGKGP